MWAGKQVLSEGIQMIFPPQTDDRNKDSDEVPCGSLDDH
jgi:hypothetical protein